MHKGVRDDVIRIRVDTTWAVLDFIRLLAEQAAEGETRAPANPAQTAIFREIAPYRLVEYDYVDDGVGQVEAVFLGFPDGSLFAADDDMPEVAVSDLIVNHVGDEPVLPAIYVYVVLRDEVENELIVRYLNSLSNHLGHAVAGVVLDGEVARAVAENAMGEVDGRIRAAARHAAEETGRHLDKATLLGAFDAMCERPDGLAYGRITYAYAKNVVEFADRAERDAFLAWTRAVCAWLDRTEGSAAELGFPEMFRPADKAMVPAATQPAARLDPPPAFNEAALGAAKRYWQYVRERLDAAGA